MMQNILNRFSTLVIVSLLIFGCSKGQTNTLGGQADPQTSLRDPQGKEEIEEAPKICSALNFEDVSWPIDYSEHDQHAFAVALNITGSFEGLAGWTNISNNFDGQGLSLGILNQNLGSQTLQPLLIKLRDNHPEVLKRYLEPDMLDSLLGMLSDWERSRPLVINSLDFAEVNEQAREFIETQDPNVDKKYAYVGLQTRASSSSVKWAIKTLYTDSKGKYFKENWKTALKNIAGDPAYVSYQIAAAQYLHLRAVEYRDRLAWGELRSYLFLFDIVVQNGSLKDKHFDKFSNWLRKNKEASEEEQMLEMLEIRVVDSHPKWQKDVRSRKTTVILGVGFVHGENRNLPEEYCYNPTMNY